MSRSVVGVYNGGRRSGKTLSMTDKGVRALILGKNVWANYPIRFIYKGKLYQSKMIDMPDLIQMQRRDEIRDGLVLLDEWNLFCNARRASSNGNLIFSGVVQLIGKRKLSVYITTQDFMTLDRNIRWQTDVTINCFDLCFQYPNLPEGYAISQYVTDWSGVFTGRILTKWDDLEARMRNSYTRYFVKASRIHNCYPTGFEYDVLEVFSRRYSFRDYDKRDNGGFDISLLSEYKAMLKQSGVDKITKSELESAIKDMGFEGEIQWEHMGRKVKAAGFSYKQTRKGGVYLLNGDNDD